MYEVTELPPLLVGALIVKSIPVVLITLILVIDGVPGTYINKGGGSSVASSHKIFIAHVVDDWHIAVMVHIPTLDDASVTTARTMLPTVFVSVVVTSVPAATYCAALSVDVAPAVIITVVTFALVNPE